MAGQLKSHRRYHTCADDEDARDRTAARDALCGGADAGGAMVPAEGAASRCHEARGDAVGHGKDPRFRP